MYYILMEMMVNEMEIIYVLMTAETGTLSINRIRS